MKKIGLGLSALLLFIVPAQAEVNKLNYNMVSLSESATRSVERDQMTVNLSIMEEGRDPVELTKKVTEKANQIIRLSRQNTQLTVTQSSRRSTRTAKKTFGDTWQETVTISIVGKDFAGINKILAQTQELARMDSVYFSLSREAKERYENELTTEALKRLSARSELIAKTMGLSGFRLVNMNVGSNSQYAPMLMNRPVMGKASSMDAAAGAAESFQDIPESASGKQDLSLSVSAQVQLFSRTK